MKYRVVGARRETGANTTIEVHASSEAAAESLANAQGVLVEQLEPCADPAESSSPSDNWEYIGGNDNIQDNTNRIVFRVIAFLAVFAVLAIIGIIGGPQAILLAILVPAGLAAAGYTIYRIVPIAMRIAEAIRLEFERRRIAEAEARKRTAADSRNQLILELRKRAHPEYLLDLDPTEFENYVLRYYSLLGYRTYTTPASGDGGIDGVLTKDGERIIIQCKRWQDAVGVRPVREFRGVLTGDSASRGILVTTSRFGKKAQEAAGPQIELIDGYALCRRINGLQCVDPQTHELVNLTVRPVARLTANGPSSANVGLIVVSVLLSILAKLLGGKPRRRRRR